MRASLDQGSSSRDPVIGRLHRHVSCPTEAFVPESCNAGMFPPRKLQRKTIPPEKVATQDYSCYGSTILYILAQGRWSESGALSRDSGHIRFLLCPDKIGMDMKRARFIPCNFMYWRDRPIIAANFQTRGRERRERAWESARPRETTTAERRVLQKPSPRYGVWAALLTGFRLAT